MALAYLLRNSRQMTAEPNRRPLPWRVSDGFTLIEMMIVVAVGITLAAVAVPVSTNYINSTRADSSLVATVDALTNARDQSIAQRRNFEIAFTSNNHIVVTRDEVPTGQTIISDTQLENGQQWLLFPTLPDTPDLFGHAAAINFTGPGPWMFSSDGTCIDSNGDPTNGTIFLGVPQRDDVGESGHDLRSDRAHAPVEVERCGVVQQLKPASGFSLVEVLVATLVLTVGLLSLVGVAAVGVQRVAQSSPMLIAREEAREAIESVHTARDTGELTWTKIQNVAAGGVFLAGPQPLKVAGPDGLMNTADDGAVETIRSAGPDGVLNTADDIITTLTNYTREIAITPLNCDAGDPPICGGVGVINPNLRQIVVTVKLSRSTRSGRST